MTSTLLLLLERCLDEDGPLSYMLLLHLLSSVSIPMGFLLAGVCYISGGPEASQRFLE